MKPLFKVFFLGHSSDWRQELANSKWRAPGFGLWLFWRLFSVFLRALTELYTDCEIFWSKRNVSKTALLSTSSVRDDFKFIQAEKVPGGKTYTSSEFVWMGESKLETTTPNSRGRKYYACGFSLPGIVWTVPWIIYWCIGATTGQQLNGQSVEGLYTQQRFISTVGSNSLSLYI